jgi:hypothetical protein
LKIIITGCLSTLEHQVKAYLPEILMLARDHLGFRACKLRNITDTAIMVEVWWVKEINKFSILTTTPWYRVWKIAVVVMLEEKSF